MIKALAKSENSFLYIIDASIFSESVITKVLYWYSEFFVIYWNRDKSTHEITLELKPNKSHFYTFESVTQKFNQDLIDFKNRDLIISETKDIRNILYVKAFANNDDFEDYNLELE